MKKQTMLALVTELEDAVASYKTIFALNKRITEKHGHSLWNDDTAAEAEHILWKELTRTYDNLTLARGGQ